MNYLRPYAWSSLFSGLASVLLSLAMGCTTEAPPPPVPPSDPPPGNNTPGNLSAEEKLYTEQVDARLAGCRSCHVDGGGFGAPVFLASAAKESYALIKQQPNLYQRPEDSLLILKGLHKGPALTEDEEAAVRQWLELEFKSEPAPAPGTLSAEQALVEFGECMNLDDWQQSGMDKFALTQTVDSGSCSTCHSGGLGGTFLASDLEATFNANKQTPYVNKLVEPEYESGKFVRLVQSNRFIEKGGEPCPEIDIDDFDICHPEFTLDAVEEIRVTTFVSKTLARLDADGSCP